MRARTAITCGTVRYAAQCRWEPQPEHRNATGIVPKEICGTAAIVNSGGNRTQLCLETGLFVCFLLLLQTRTVRCTGCGAELKHLTLCVARAVTAGNTVTVSIDSPKHRVLSTTKVSRAC